MTPIKELSPFPQKPGIPLTDTRLVKLSNYCSVMLMTSGHFSAFRNINVLSAASMTVSLDACFLSLPSLQAPVAVDRVTQSLDNKPKSTAAFTCLINHVLYYVSNVASTKESGRDIRVLMLTYHAFTVSV